MSFSQFDLHHDILRALELHGYIIPTPVQAEAIPKALNGQDILANAQTGTGKTAAFLLPVLQHLVTQPAIRPAGSPRILVLTPTRELARQILNVARDLGKFIRINTVELVGGMPYRDQLRFLSKSIDIVVATPGRLIDHLDRGRLNLSFVDTLILDEADRMLDMGFLEDVLLVAKACNHDRQTLLFSATMDKRMAKLATNLLRNPARIAIEDKEISAQIDQRVLHVDDLSHKRRLLEHLANSNEISKAIIFASTRRDASNLANDLAASGHAVAALHGDMAQRDRNRTLDRLKSGMVRLLVATDVAARGIDVRDISHVINFDMPRAAEDYVHRIGRTGRAGAEGIALSFVGRSDRTMLSRVQQFTKIVMNEMVVPGLEPRQPMIKEAVKRIAVARKPHRGGKKITPTPLFQKGEKKIKRISPL